MSEIHADESRQLADALDDLQIDLGMPKTKPQPTFAPHSRTHPTNLPTREHTLL